MSKETEALKGAAKWSVLREFRPVVERFGDVVNADITEASAHKELETLFSHYFARLVSEAARFDRPEARIYMQLAPICSPDVFLGQDQKTVESKLSQLGKPGADSRDPLYPIAREVQHMALGSVYLRSASPLFKKDEFSSMLNPVIIERVFESPSMPKLVTARIPLILTGVPGTSSFMDANVNLLERVVEGLGQVETPVTVNVNHLPYSYSKEKEIVKYTGTHMVLDWAFANPGARLESPIVGALMNNSSLGFNSSLFESITISSGEFSKKWLGASKERFFGSYTFDQNIWKYWSFNNTIYQIKNVATGNILRDAAKLGFDIVSIPNIEFDSARNAALAVHMPILISAAGIQVFSKGVEQALNIRAASQGDTDRRRSEQENNIWF